MNESFEKRIDDFVFYTEKLWDFQNQDFSTLVTAINICLKEKFITEEFLLHFLIALEKSDTKESSIIAQVAHYFHNLKIFDKVISNNNEPNPFESRFKLDGTQHNQNYPSKEPSLLYDDIELFREEYLDNYRFYTFGYDVLDRAAFYGSPCCFKFLLLNGFSPNFGTLIESFKGGNFDIIRICLTYCKPNDECLDTALEFHRVKCVDYLCTRYNMYLTACTACHFYDFFHGIKILRELFKQKKSSSEVFKACATLINKDCNFVVDYIFEKGYLYDNEMNPLHFAMLKQNYYVIDRIFEKYSNKEQIVVKPMTPLMYAANGLPIQMLEHILEKQVDVNYKDEDGRSAIYYAMAAFDIDKVELLLQHGANINQKNNNGVPYISHFAKYHNFFMKLLELNPDVNIEDDNGRNVLNYVLPWADYWVISQLHYRGIKVKNVLIDAIHRSMEDIVELLIRIGADINETQNGTDAIDAALSVKTISMLEIVLNHGATVKINHLLNCMKKKYKRKIFRMLIKGLRESIDTKLDDGRCIIHYAASITFKDYLTDVLEAKASVNIRDNSRKTPLIYATRNECYKNINTLIKYGADINISDNRGMKAIDYARQKNFFIIEQIFQDLSSSQQN